VWQAEQHGLDHDAALAHVDGVDGRQLITRQSWPLQRAQKKPCDRRVHAAGEWQASNEQPRWISTGITRASKNWRAGVLFSVAARLAMRAHSRILVYFMSLREPQCTPPVATCRRRQDERAIRSRSARRVSSSEIARLGMVEKLLVVVVAAGQVESDCGVPWQVTAAQLFGARRAELSQTRRHAAELLDDPSRTTEQLPSPGTS
jgi:hypothetical protein